MRADVGSGSGRDTADVVVIGGGTVGGWASWFARQNGAERVIVLERDFVGQGASSRAAGIVRAQGGTRETVALGRWSIDFYNRQRELVGTDSGFRELGYLLLAVTSADERDGRERVEMQRAVGLDARWVSAPDAVGLNPTLASNGFRGA
jgi:sarcosine oxidase, subunit beta